ncbi:MAG: AAA family ATPase [Alphaproteobacteria bacterium]
MLIIFGGAPGTGKTTLSRQLALALKAVYLRIDTMDQPIMAVYGDDIADTSYRVAHGIARDNLRLGPMLADTFDEATQPTANFRTRWRSARTDIPFKPHGCGSKPNRPSCR